MILICAASSGHNLTMAEHIAKEASVVGLETELLDLTRTELPMYTPDREAQGVPSMLPELEKRFIRAEGYVVCSPEYNGSVPPVLTNTIAWLSVQSDDFRALFNGKPVALATHSGGHGAKALMAMRIQFSHLGCTILGRDLTANKNKPFNAASAQRVLGQLKALTA